MIHISTSFALLVVAIIILVCIAGSRLSGRLGVPTLFIFIMLGMLFGSDGIFKIPFGNFALAEQVCSVALIFIMFYGGFGTRWSEAKPVAGRSILLSSAGVVLTAFLTGMIFGFFLKGREITWKTVLPASLIVILGCNLCLDTLWLSILMGQGYLALLPARILKCVLMLPIHLILIPFVWNRIVSKIPFAGQIAA